MPGTPGSVLLPPKPPQLEEWLYIAYLYTYIYIYLDRTLTYIYIYKDRTPTYRILADSNSQGKVPEAHLSRRKRGRQKHRRMLGKLLLLES